MTPELKPGYDCVFTVTDYRDGPLKGIANYRGEPHFYERVCDDAKDDNSELFRLTPIDAETFRVAMEDWNIWRRWESAFHNGKADINTHPALPHEAGRHAELKRILDESLVTDPQKAFTLAGQFESLGEPGLSKGVWQPLQVKWVAPQMP
jgi:hypothetical protein